MEEAGLTIADLVYLNLPNSVAAVWEVFLIFSFFPEGPPPPRKYKEGRPPPAQEKIIKKIFWPSSIAVFGPNTEKKNTPQFSITEPNTIYGISKLAGERWCEYYYNQYQIDVVSLRYPGLIGWKSQPGGGTTDYAVEIFHEAIKNKSYNCFLKKDTAFKLKYTPYYVGGRPPHTPSAVGGADASCPMVRENSCVL